MATPSPVRLLIADRSENRAHEIDSVLRNAGIATRSEFCGDLSDDSVAEQAIDLLLCRSGFDHLEQVLPALRKRKPDLPIIVMDDSSEPKNLTRGLAMGATDVVFDDDNERFLYVVKRELENVCQRHRFTQTRRALQEAERRCELLSGEFCGCHRLRARRHAHLRQRRLFQAVRFRRRRRIAGAAVARLDGRIVHRRLQGKDQIVSRRLERRVVVCVSRSHYIRCADRRSDDAVGRRVRRRTLHTGTRPFGDRAGSAGRGTSTAGRSAAARSTRNRAGTARRQRRQCRFVPRRRRPFSPRSTATRR